VAEIAARSGSLELDCVY